jgi:hypothetical protein
MSGAAGPPTAIVHPQRGNRTGQCFKRRTASFQGRLDKRRGLRVGFKCPSIFSGHLRCCEMGWKL